MSTEDSIMVRFVHQVHEHGEYNFHNIKLKNRILFGIDA